MLPRYGLLLLVVACGARETTPAPSRVPVAGDVATVVRDAPVTPWAQACAETIRKAVDVLGAKGFRYRHTDISSCPAPLRATSHPDYVQDACDEPGVDASFQGPGDPEHIYLSIEELAKTTPPPAHRGMMPWARQRATAGWSQLDKGHTRHVFRQSTDRIVLIRLLMDGRPTNKAQAFMEALRGAADDCLE